MSKTLATIDTHAEIAFDPEKAKYGNPYTKEAYELFQRLQFKNLLGRFDVEATANRVEERFCEVTDRQEIETVFAKACQAERVGVSIWKDDGNVLPLFVHASGYGRISIAYDEEKVYSIPCSMETDMDALFEKLGEVQAAAGEFVMFDLKQYLSLFQAERHERCFDATVAAYLLNPLKNDYMYEDVAREQLGLLIDEKADGMCRSCYEAYTAWKAAPLLKEKLAESGMYELFRDIKMPLLFTLYGIEQAGIHVEGEALKSYGDQLGGRITELEQEICEEAGETFNINSPKQLGVILFEKLGLPGGKRINWRRIIRSSVRSWNIVSLQN